MTLLSLTELGDFVTTRLLVAIIDSINEFWLGGEAQVSRKQCGLYCFLSHEWRLGLHAPLNPPLVTILRLLLIQRFLTFRCIPCVKIKNTDIVLPF